MTNPKKTIKPAAPQQRPLTKEERIAAVERGFTQKYNSLLEGALYNAIHGFAQSGSTPEPSDIVDFVIATTDEFMEKSGPACEAAFDRIIRPKLDVEKTDE